MKEGDSLCLGSKELVFYDSMVQRPETMVSYCRKKKILFSEMLSAVSALSRKAAS